MNMFLARNARASSHNSSPYYDSSQREPHSLDINYNALPGEKNRDENAGNGGQACPPPNTPTHLGKVSCSPLASINRDGNTTNSKHHGRLSL